MSEGKKCTKCRIYKPYSEYYKNASRKDGHQYTCKECCKEYHKKYYKQNKGKIVQQVEEYRKQNKEKVAECQKEYRTRNKEKVAERKKKWYQQNKEKVAEYQKEYRTRNKEKVAEYHKEYREQNKEKIAEKRKKYYQQNREKIAEYQEEYRTQNKEEIAERRKKYYQQNREKASEHQKKYYQQNKEKIADRYKKWYQQNKEKLAEYHNEYRRGRRQNDPAYRLRCLVSNAIRKALSNNNSSKEGNSTWDALPYTPQQLREHLEAQFEEGMSWNNYGEWHIDHFYPQSELPYESLDDENFRLAWDLRNLRPLWAAENISKGNQIIEGAEKLLLEIKKDLDKKWEG